MTVLCFDSVKIDSQTSTKFINITITLVHSKEEQRNLILITSNLISFNNQMPVYDYDTIE